MTTVFIIHGLGGNPEENWFPWLRTELEKLGHKVIVPAFPSGELHQQDEWLKTIQAYEKNLTENPIFVGHSVAGAFILTLLEKFTAQAAFLVAPFIGPLGLPDFDQRNKTFTERDFDWTSIRKNCPHFEIFHSDNDPYVPLIKAEELSKHLNIPITLVPGAGHFNQSTGFTKFELLLTQIRALIA